MSDALAARIEAIRKHVNTACAQARAVAQEVEVLDTGDLGDDLEESVREVLGSLADVHRALIGADQPLGSAIHHAKRLP